MNINTEEICCHFSKCLLLTFSIPITFPPKPHLLMLRSKLDFLYPHAAFVLCSGIAATVRPQLFCSASQSENRLLPQGLKRAAFHACDAQVPRRPFKQPAALQGGCWNRGNAVGSPHGTGANSSSPHLMLWYVLGTGKQHTLLQSARQDGNLFIAHQQAVQVHLASLAFLTDTSPSHCRQSHSTCL